MHRYTILRLYSLLPSDGRRNYIDQAGLAGGVYQRWLYGSFGLSCLDWSSFQLCLRLGAIVSDVLHRAVVRRRDGGDVLGARPLVAPSVIRLYGFV